MAHADVMVLLDVYPARERAEEHPGVSGLTIAEATADAAQGRPVYWLPAFADAQPVLEWLLEDGDLCLVMGAGDVQELGRTLAGTGTPADARGGVAVNGAVPPATVRANFALERLTTVRTGGAAEFFARAGSEAELLELLAWAARRGPGGERGGVGLESAGRRRRASAGWS